MSEQKTYTKQNNRLDKFLFYSKFALLIIIALLFLIAYSLLQRDLPASTAQFHINMHSSDYANCGGVNYPKARSLIVVDSTNYSDDSYTSFFQLKDLMDANPYLDYDLLVLNNTISNSSVLDRIDKGLLLRIHRKKEYQYIISIGDNAINTSKEIKELFFPESEILLYGATSTAIHNTITPVKSVKEYVANTISASLIINPSTDKLVFLADTDDYSKIIMNIVENQQKHFDSIGYDILLLGEYDINTAINKINKQNENVSIFYISFLDNNNNDLLSHSDVIRHVKNGTSNTVYDLSPITTGDDIKESIRYWSLDASDEPLAYLGVSPEDKCIHNYELVEFAAKNIMLLNADYSNMRQYKSNSAFIGWCMEKMNFDDFPKILGNQYKFCEDNSLLITKDQLQSGDLVFTSSKSHRSIDDIENVYIYVNEEVVIGFNSYGLLSFTKPVNDIYQVAYASPYPYFDEK